MRRVVIRHSKDIYTTFITKTPFAKGQQTPEMFLITPDKRRFWIGVGEVVEMEMLDV